MLTNIFSIMSVKNYFNKWPDKILLKKLLKNYFIKYFNKISPKKFLKTYSNIYLTKN